MKKIKILLIILLIIIVSLVISLYLINRINEDNQETNHIKNILENQVEEIYVQEENQDIIGEVKENSVITDQDYITLQKNVSNFLSVINKNSSTYYNRDGEKVITDEEIANRMINLLSTVYIQKNNITTRNINQYIYNIDKGALFIPTKINKFYELDRVNSFVIQGLVEDVEYNPIIEIMIILNMDTTNNTFSIEILNSQQDINSIVPEKIDKIDKNDMNVYTYSKLTEENIIREIINLYKRTVLGYPEYFYNNYLNADYRNIKFNSLNEFKNYIQKNKILIGQINIKQYKKIEEDNLITYIVKDQYDNTSIISYNTIIEYKMYLDNYTVELDSFKEEYEQANDATKIAIQIGKFKQMLNSKDYSAIYNKLNPVFKQNNFSTISKLEAYLRENTYEINSINIEDAEEKEDYYVCICTLKNQKNQQETKQINIIIKLIDSNNFELSFSM